VLERDLDVLAFFRVINLKEFSLGESKSAGDQIRWKDLKLGVEVAHVARYRSVAKRVLCFRYP
jgi:hypothetical protein